MKSIDLFSGSLKEYLILCFLLFTSFSCKDEPVKPPDNVDFSISVEDVSCIEAWISLKTASASELKLFRNDSLIKTLNTFPIDTIVYDEGLLPNQSYIYKAEVLFNNKTYTKEAAAQTMDTTSHNYTWQSWEFGQHSSSQLFDVAIIDENNIWAVGEIYMKDSLGQSDPHPYNSVHWDGEKWELKKIYYNYNGSNLSLKIKSILTFNASDIWFDAHLHWNGAIFEQINISGLVGFSINEIWGTSLNNIFIVGNNGSIAHYNGTSWKRLESGTDYNINDIWGDYNEKTGEWEILAVAADINHSMEREILGILSSGTEKLDQNNITDALSGIWFKSCRKYYVVGSGIYMKNFLNENSWKGPLKVNSTFINKIRGTDYNNIFTAGAFGEIIHFNGINWKNYLSETGSFYGTYFSLDVKGCLLYTSS